MYAFRLYGYGRIFCNKTSGCIGRQGRHPEHKVIQCCVTLLQIEIRLGFRSQYLLIRGQKLVLSQNALFFIQVSLSSFLLNKRDKVLGIINYEVKSKLT